MRVLSIFVAGFYAINAWAQVALTPSTPAITPSPVFVPGSPAISPGVATVSPPATNATLVALSQSLVILQTNLQQTLPLLINFNDSFDFVDITGNTTGAQSGNAAGAVGANLGVNSAANIAVNRAVPPGTAFLNPPMSAAAAAQARAGSAQGVATMPITRDQLRALLVLQSDLQRMLPVLNALNGGATNAPGTFTGLFGVPATSP